MSKINENRKGYKHTKLGWIPEGWEVVKLGDIGNFKNGINKDKSDFGFGYSFINLNDAFGYSVFTQNLEDLNKVNVNLNEVENYSLKSGDVLFIRSSVKSIGVGLTTLIPKDLLNTVFSGFIIRFRDNGHIYQNYKIHCFYEEKFRQRLLSKSTISANTNINQVALSSLQIPLPPLTEQKKIADILSKWDVAIEHTQDLIEQLKHRNKGLAQQLLTGKKRLKGFEGKWENLRINDVTTKFSRKNKNLVDAEIYSVTNSSGFVLQSDHFEGRVAGADLTGYKIVKKGEFAYNPARVNVGSLGLFYDEIGVISSLYVCFRTNEKVTNEYLLTWFGLDQSRHSINAFGEGGVRVYLWYELFSKIKIELPPLKEQQAISNILAKADEELKRYEDKLAELQVQKKGMMQKLLMGEVRVF